MRDNYTRELAKLSSYTIMLAILTSKLLPATLVSFPAILTTNYISDLVGYTSSTSKLPLLDVVDTIKDCIVGYKLAGIQASYISKS